MIDAGTTLIAFRYKVEVIIAADTSVTYEGIFKHKHLKRIDKLEERKICFIRRNDRFSKS